MAEIKFLDDTTIHTCLSTATQGDTLTSLGATSRAISNTTGDLNNATELDLWGDVEFTVVLGSAPADGAVIGDFYILPSVDNTQFPTASNTVTPTAAHLAGSFRAAGTSTTQVAVIRAAPLVPRKMRFFYLNGAIALSGDTHTIKIKPYKIQSV